MYIFHDRYLIAFSVASQGNLSQRGGEPGDACFLAFCLWLFKCFLFSVASLLCSALILYREQTSKTKNNVLNSHKSAKKPYGKLWNTPSWRGFICLIYTQTPSYFLRLRMQLINNFALKLRKRKWKAWGHFR